MIVRALVCVLSGCFLFACGGVEELDQDDSNLIVDGTKGGPIIVPLRPDLVPIFADAGCGNVTIQIKNQGVVAAGPSWASIGAQSGGSGMGTAQPIPGLAVGASYTITLEGVPNGWSWTARADTQGQVAESNEKNNVTSGGTCVD